MTDELIPNATINELVAENTKLPNRMEWGLNPELFKHSIFEKKKMREHTNPKKIYGFIQHKMGISYEGIRRYEKNPHSTELIQITKYKEQYNKKQKIFNTSHNLPKHKWGRVIPSNYCSLAIFHRPTRHSLCEEIYVDIDMKNAQPTILAEICNHHNLTKNALTKYVKEPKKYRNLIMEHHKCDKTAAKQLPITLMTGGTYDGWLSTNEIDVKITKMKFIVDIENEMRDIIEIIYTANKDVIGKDVLKQDKNKWKTEDEKKRGIMSLWGQSLERLIQETSIKWLCDNMDFELEDIVPCQDGFMILKNLYYEGIINDIENVILEKFNINIKYEVKPFDEAIDIPISEGQKTFEEWDDLLSEKKLADRFMDTFGNYTARNGDLLFVYYETKLPNSEVIGRWYDETNKDKRYKLTLYISENIYDKLNEDISFDVSLDENEQNTLLKTLRTKTSNKIQKIIEHILPKIKEGITFNNQPLLLGFNNGVIELPTATFRPYKYDDYMTITTGYDYDPNFVFDRTKCEELTNIILTIQPDEDQRRLLLQFLASALDGKLYQKLVLLNGRGGNGKGLIAKLMRYMLGDYYYQPPNSIIKDFEKGQTASPELYACMGKRYINFTEVDGKIRVAMLRNLTGGGMFNARLLRENPVEFSLSAIISMEFNNAPDLDGKPMDSDYRRLIHMMFPINFTDDENKIDKIIDGIQYKRANPYYETEEFVMTMRPYFLDLLLKVYKECFNEDAKCIVYNIPDEVRSRTNKFIEDQNKFQNVFNTLFVKREIKTDKKEEKDKKTLRIKDFWRIFQSTDEYKDLKTTRQRQEYGRDECYKWLRNNFTVRIDKKNGDYILGVILKEDDTEQEEVEKEEKKEEQLDGETEKEDEDEEEEDVDEEP